MDRRGTIARLLEIGMPEGFRILHDIKKEIAKLKHQVEIAEQKNEALQMCYTNGSESQLQHMLGEAQDPLVAAVKASAAAANLYEGLHSSVEVGKDQEELAYYICTLVSTSSAYPARRCWTILLKSSKSSFNIMPIFLVCNLLQVSGGAHL